MSRTGGQAGRPGAPRDAAMGGVAAQRDGRPSRRRAVRVLVVDDSHFVRRALARLLASDPRVEVVGAAASGAEALEQVLALGPDVVTLDVEMPGMDGLATLDALMRRRPTPVIMVSAHTAAGARVTLQALARGAVDFVSKPGGPVSMDLGALRDELLGKVLAASVAHPRTRFGRAVEAGRAVPRAARPARAAGGRRRGAVGIGASTGGVMALQTVLAAIPRPCGAPVFVAQHMPALFTASLAAMLCEAAGVAAVEARDGEAVEPDRVYVAPGGLHMTLAREGTRGDTVRLRVSTEPAAITLRPSVDLLFASLAEVYGAGAVAVILTGMGTDGTVGLAAVKRAGGLSVAQDESTSVVYGMPGSAVRAGLADVVAPVGRIGEEVARAMAATRAEA